MKKLTIIGNKTPTVGKTETYALSVFDHSVSPNVFQPNSSKKAEWYIDILENGIWKRLKGDHKEGDAVTFRFSQRSLFRKAIKIVVKRDEDKGELLIKPQRAKEAKITRVELLDENYQPIPKGRILSYKDTLIARAHCVEMFWNYISFTLWEDDAKGEGHNPIINMMNKINPSPLRGEVNEKGIAEVTFRLPAYTMAVQIANARIAAGDQDEGTTHEYYVTAELVSKNIIKASPNVNVANPTHIPPPVPPKPKAEPSPPKRKGEIVLPPHPNEGRLKPKEETPKFPVTPNGKRHDDPEGKILNAEFVNRLQQPLKSATIGEIVVIKITSRNMKGQNVTVRIWQHDVSKYVYIQLYERNWNLIGDESFIGIIITKEMFRQEMDYLKGPDEEFFIEVEPDNTHATSQVIPISKTAPKLEVESSASVAIIKKPKEKQTDGKCPRCEKLTEDEVDKLFNTASKANKKALIDAFNYANKKFEINTCIRKAHFFAQVLAEVGTDLKLNEPEGFNYSVRRLKGGDYVKGSNWVKGSRNPTEGGYYSTGNQKDWKSTPFSYFKKIIKKQSYMVEKI